jgi:hypothetical protein
MQTKRSVRAVWAALQDPSVLIPFAMERATLEPGAVVRVWMDDPRELQDVLQIVEINPEKSLRMKYLDPISGPYFVDWRLEASGAGTRIEVSTKTLGGESRPIRPTPWASRLEDFCRRLDGK